jgi:excisionase family DNA binding protein
VESLQRYQEQFRSFVVRGFMSIVANIANNSYTQSRQAILLSNLAAMTNLAYPAYIPQDEDAQLSRESSRILAPHINSAARHIKIIEPDGTEQSALIPAAAYRLLVDVLTQMAQGNAVTLIPIHAELTTQEAADLLNVSRPYLIKQIEAGAIPYHKIGRHRRIRFEDLMAYKQQVDAARSQALDELVAESQALGLYD